MKEVFKIKIDFSDIAEIREFVNKANTIPNDVNLFQAYTTVSGKSILGVSSLDLNKPISLIVRDREDDEIVCKTFGRWLI